MNGECPTCVATVLVEEDAQLGEIVVCPDCGLELEVTALDPLTLSVAPRVEEDWGE